MTVMIVLRSEELVMARDGEIPEPSFRPWPGSARAREESLAWRYGEEDDEDTGEDTDKDMDEDGRVRPAQRTGAAFPRVASAETWKRHSVTAAVLLAELDGKDWIVALGTFEGRPRANVRGARNMEVRVGRMLDAPVPLAFVIGVLGKTARAGVLRGIRGPLHPLPRKLNERLLAELEHAVPEVRAELDSLVRDATLRLSAALGLGRSPASPLHEASASALHLFTPSWHRLVPSLAPDPDASSIATRLDDLGLLENDVITDDAGAFPDWDRSTYSRRGWWEFHHHGRRLLVKNINVSPQEARTGADLVYVRTDPDAFVLVQYKLAETLTSGRVVFRPDPRLSDQVERMLALENAPRGSVDADAEGTYRLGSGFTFVKFVHPERATPRRPGELAPGWYLPGDFVRRMLLSPGRGPNNGAVHYVAEKRSLTSETFAQLVRNGMVGSTGDATTRLMALFGLRGLQNVVLAVDEPLPGA